MSVNNMANYLILLAGGSGTRMGANMPKQFLIVNDKPVVVHTIENFQRNETIEGIVIVCLKEWITYMQSIVEEYNLTKVKWVIEGGATGHDSTRNGIFFLKDKIKSDDFVIIHDAARPILPQKAINDMLEVAKENGNASLAIPCYETAIFTDDKLSGVKDLDRNSFMRVQTPQAYLYKEILPLYERAEEEDKHDFVYADLVYIYYGKRVFFSKGFTNNIKITKKEDIALCEALMKFAEDELYSL